MLQSLKNELHYIHRIQIFVYQFFNQPFAQAVAKTFLLELKKYVSLKLPIQKQTRAISFLESPN